MKFRPCIDIHNGLVRQIVGGTLRDTGNHASINYSSPFDAAHYAEIYKEYGLKGGHIILLNGTESEYYEKTKQQAVKALQLFPGGMQIGGGIHAGNAKEYLALGASHVIVTSYVFQDGTIRWGKLEELSETVGKNRLVIDLSCRKKGAFYYIVTNRWQTFTKEKLSVRFLEKLSLYCDEFLIHGVDVEGKSSGVEVELVQMLSNWSGCPITYAGGIGSLKDVEEFQKLSHGKLDFTIGSALDLFGGQIPFASVCRYE